MLTLIMVKLAEKLVDMGIDFSEDAISKIYRSTYKWKELKGIAPEFYSRMSESLQKALFKAQ